MILSENIENYFGGEFAFSTTLKNQNIVLIDKEEKRITTDLLGYELFKQFNNDLINKEEKRITTDFLGYDLDFGIVTAYNSAPLTQASPIFQENID